MASKIIEEYEEIEKLKKIFEEDETIITGDIEDFYKDLLNRNSKLLLAIKQLKDSEKVDKQIALTIIKMITIGSL